MILSQTIGCASKFGEIKSIELIAKAGFDAIDYRMSPMRSDSNILNSAEYKKYVSKLCDTAKRNNVFFNQGHAVSYIYHEDAEIAYKLLVQRNIRAIEIAGLMGKKILTLKLNIKLEYIKF